MTDHLVDELLSRTLPAVTQWIDQLTTREAPKAVSVASLGFSRLTQYYGIELLEAAKVIALPKVPVPPLSSMGLAGFEDFESMASDGITYGDLYFVVESRRRDEALHFHELVHVLQWRLLGKERFIRSYALGHIMHGGYNSNPLELMAYRLQASFEREARPFDVASVVARELGSGL